MLSNLVHRVQMWWKSFQIFVPFENLAIFFRKNENISIEYFFRNKQGWNKICFQIFTIFHTKENSDTQSTLVHAFDTQSTAIPYFVTNRSYCLVGSFSSPRESSSFPYFFQAMSFVLFSHLASIPLLWDF
jgi:hypothetical protein